MRIPLSVRLSSVVCVVSAVIPNVSAAPAITSVANAASNRGFASGIAQGSIFVIYGTGLGPASISVASAAFQNTSLSGTSVAVTVGTTTNNALMYYTSATQVAALLPSNTPVGSATFTVTYNGQTSAPVGQIIVASNPGIFTIDSSGQGPAIVTYPDGTLVSAAKSVDCGALYTACGAANPGDTLILWGTGLGPVNGDDAAGAGLGQNMPGISLTMWMGGVQVPVSYQGRSGCCVGEDQIVFTVPDNAPTGCAVPLVVQIGATVSNSAVMPVANGSRTCTPTNPALATIDIERAVLAGSATFGVIELDKFLNAGAVGRYDAVQFEFAKIFSFNPGAQPFFLSYVDDQPLGTCNAYNANRSHSNPPIGGLADLDAGSSFTIQGPNGSVTVTGTAGQFSATLSGAGTFLGSGAYTITGAGGADVGSFSASITIPPSPTLISPPNAVNLAVTRSAGMTVTWIGGDANGTVRIQVLSAIDSAFNNAADVICTAPASAGRFTIPPYVLLALPIGGFTAFQFAPAARSVPFSAAGLSVGILQSYNDGSIFGGFVVQ